MSNKPFFTIGIPVYNMSKWVGECLDSILSQNFTDFEIICVDDGSRDNSLEVLNNYAARDSRIKVIARENGGVSTARNCIFCYAEGEYIFTIDSDDIMCKDVLGTFYKTIVDNNYPDILQTSHLEEKNGIIKEVLRDYPGDKYFDCAFSKDERAVRLWLDRTFMPFGSTRFVKREFLANNGIMQSKRYTAFEDSAFSFDLYRKADTIAYSPVSSFIYCLSRDDVPADKINYKSFKSTLLRWNDFYTDIDSWNLSEQCRRLVACEKDKFVTEYRDKLLTLFEAMPTAQDSFKAICLVEDLLGEKIKKLPLPKGKNGLIFFIARFIGIEKTMKILYRYLASKGITK